MPPVKWLVLVLAVFAALLSTAFFAVPELATLRGAKADNATAFLTRELGQPQAGASLVGAPTRTWPALGGKLQIAGGGLRASAGRSTVALRLAAPGTGAWRVAQVVLVTLAAAVYLVALVRSPD